MLLNPSQWDVVGQSPSGPQGVLPSQSPSQLGVLPGQSPRQQTKAKRPTVSPITEIQAQENAGLRMEKARGTGSPILANFHSSNSPGDVDEGVQNKRSTQDQGQIKYNTSREGENREERRSGLEAGGRLSEKTESAHADSGRFQIHGMATRDVQIFEDSKFEEDDRDFYGGEKNRRKERSTASKREDGSVEISQAGEKGNPDAARLGQVVETRTMVEYKVKLLSSTQQQKEDFVPGQLSLTDRGAGEGEDADQEAGRAQGLELVLGRPNRMDPGPKTSMNLTVNELGSYGNTDCKSTEKRVELRQELQLRSSLQQNHICSCSGDSVRNDKHQWKPCENRDGQSKEFECLDIHGYDDNISEESTSALLSVFGRPLLQGEISGLGGINGEENLEPLRVVAADGREWGIEFSGALIEEGEGLVVDDSRTNGEQNEASEPWTYESWGKSCLAKFSDFLGFPTKGFEKEITNLLRNLVNAQKVGKGKECQSLSKSERELRILKWTINYKGKETCREDGRDRGQLFLKLK